jgi:thiamine biosynthesis lipoprotein
LPWNRPLIIGIILLLLALGWLRTNSGDNELVRRSRLMMGTIVEIVASGQDTGQLNAAVDDAFAEMARLDRLLSRHYQDSDVSRLSQSSRGGKVAQETAEVVALGLDVARRSKGAFDMTLGHLKILWGIDQENPVIPTQAAIAEALEGTGFQSLSLEGLNLIKQSPQLMVDLGGIAKGYIVDQAVVVLKKHGVTSGAVNAGGDMYLLGQHPEHPWRIGIQHPREQGGILATVQVRDKAVVTSGDYERFFEQEGQRYHHIFDPETGSPARGCQSVTVITDSVALGDALATALFVLGPQKGLALLAEYPGSAGLIVAADGTLHPSPGWANYTGSP